jgi:hypothetical protein
MALWFVGRQKVCTGYKRKKERNRWETKRERKEKYNIG